MPNPNARTFTQDFTNNDLVQVGDTYVLTVQHNLDSLWPVIVFWAPLGDYIGTSGFNISSIDSNAFKITFFSLPGFTDPYHIRVVG